MNPCPVCSLLGGFHDTSIHNQRLVPREFVKEKDWWMEDYLKIKLEKASVKK